MLRSLSTALSLVAIVLLFTACKPTYPKCDNDDHCAEKSEYCVNGMCQQCRDSKDCPKGQKCNKGRCDKIIGYCDSTEDCKDGQACINNRCGPCQNDGQCGAGAKCKDGKCLSPGQCLTDDDCPENHECQNGSCAAPPPDTTVQGTDLCSKLGLTQLPTIYFDFDEFVLSPEATQALQQAVKCLKKVNRRVRLEGHCDQRGTEEYNLALGDRRGRSVLRYLQRLGAPRNRIRTVSKGKLEATGFNEASRAKDRKVTFIWE